MSNNDIKSLAHKLLNRTQHGAPAPEHVKVDNPQIKLALPHHVLVHAHEYVGKIMKAKGFL